MPIAKLDKQRQKSIKTFIELLLSKADAELLYVSDMERLNLFDFIEVDTVYEYYNK